MSFDSTRSSVLAVRLANAKAGQRMECEGEDTEHIALQMHRMRIHMVSVEESEVFEISDLK